MVMDCELPENSTCVKIHYSNYSSFLMKTLYYACNNAILNSTLDDMYLEDPVTMSIVANFIDSKVCGPMDADDIEI